MLLKSGRCRNAAARSSPNPEPLSPGPRTMALLLAVMILSTTACHVFGIRTEETPKFSVVAEDGDKEIRRYAPQIQVRTWVEGDYEASTKTAFRKLFDYISGNNSIQRSIPMTAPVMQARAAEKVVMTAPVIRSPGAGGWTMAFIAPEQYTLETVPKPIDPRIELVETPAKTVAVVRYTGSLSEDTIERYGAELTEWLQGHGYRPLSQPQSAGYDPPWTLPFLRRNEVQIEIQFPE